MLMVCEFPDVFPKYICDLPRELRVEFTIYLAPGTRSVSMAPYRMSASDLGKVKERVRGYS